MIEQMERLCRLIRRYEGFSKFLGYGLPFGLRQIFVQQDLQPRDCDFWNAFEEWRGPGRKLR